MRIKTIFISACLVFAFIFVISYLHSKNPADSKRGGQTSPNMFSKAIRFDFSPSFLERFQKEIEKGHFTANSKAFTAKVLRPYARPGERWIEVEVSIRRQTTEGRGQNRSESSVAGLGEAGPGSTPPVTVESNFQFTALVYALGGNKPVAKASIEPQREKGKVLVDLRSLNLKEAKLILKLAEDGKEIGTKELMLFAQEPEKPLKAGEKIKILIDVPEGITNLVNWPVMVGVPFPAGVLWNDDQVRLVDQKGNEIPSQKEITGRWAPEGAIKWLRFDALVNPQAGCFIEVLPDVGRALAAPPSSSSTLRAKALHKNALYLTENDGKIIINTGVSKYLLGKGLSPIQEIWLGNRKIATSEKTRGLYVVDQKGRLASASADDETILVEAKGPVASCVRFEGWYKTEEGEPLAKHITRVENFAGQPFARITHTLVLSQSTTNLWFKDIGWEFAVTPGTNPQALFGVSRSNWQKSYSVPRHTDTLTRRNSDTSSVYMLQDQHYMMAHGTNHFVVAKSDSSGKSDKLLEGEECGDFACLAGRNGALMFACRDTALQHPKEFEVMQDKIVLHLFSNRAGEELDFRTPALVKRWDLRNWINKCTGCWGGVKQDTNFVSNLLKYNSNAIGWSKTHQLLVNPLPHDKTAEMAARLSKLFRDPVYALADPWWIYETRTMGPMYPQDKKRFPEVEQEVEAVMNMWLEADRKWGENGFVDYFAGPHIDYTEVAEPYRYCWVTYCLRTDIWRMYARSGSRAWRDFCEGTTRSFMDNNHMHWNPLPGSSLVRGLFRKSSNFNVPFYWGDESAFDLAGSSDFHNYMWYYYLTGDRRVRDVMKEYIQGAKQAWNPGLQHWERVIMITRLLAQCYEFTLDPELLALTEANTDLFYDPACAMQIGNKQDGGSYYKIFSNVRGLIDAWEILGNPRYQDMAMQAAEISWQDELGERPNYNPGMAFFGNFLYTETSELRYAQAMAISLRQAVEPSCALSKHQWHLGAYQASLILEADLALDVLVRSGADTNLLCSWIAYNNFFCDSDNYEKARVLFQRAHDAPTTLYFKFADAAHSDPLLQREGIRLRCLEPRDIYGTYTLLHLDERPAGGSGRGSGVLSIPKDLPESEKTFEIILPSSSNLTDSSSGLVLADSRIPMVLYAPGYWAPACPQSPPLKYYFNLPKDSKNARIFFEARAKLFDPSGALFGASGTNETVHGWIDLPADKPGLWAFESAEAKKIIRVRNLPPFFAAGDSNNYFTPAIVWTNHQSVRVK